MSVSIATPLRIEQVQIACRLHGQLRQWQQADAALGRLAEVCPGFSLDECLLKVVAIDTLYGTNLYAHLGIAEHVARVMERNNRTEPTPRIVDELASPPANGDKKARKCLSFASKFAHFFIDAAACPIFDKYAVDTLQHHLGKRKCTGMPGLPYECFVAGCTLLADSAGVPVGRDLDRYLWLSGMYRRWEASGRTAKINREVKQVFQATPGSILLQMTTSRS